MPQPRPKKTASALPRPVRAADSFELGQAPMDSLTGQGGIFDAPSPTKPAAAKLAGTI